jgi:hypothetical protein
MGLTKIVYARSMVFRSTRKFLPGWRLVLGSLLFIADKFGDLSLQKPKSLEVTRLGTGRVPPASVQVGFVNKAQLEHRCSMLGETPQGIKQTTTRLVPQPQ